MQVENYGCVSVQLLGVYKALNQASLSPHCAFMYESSKLGKMGKGMFCLSPQNDDQVE
jgi:hypothetical protein